MWAQFWKKNGIGRGCGHWSSHDRREQICDWWQWGLCMCVVFFGGCMRDFVYFCSLLSFCSVRVPNKSPQLSYSGLTFHFFAGLSNGSHRQIRRSCVCLFNREGQTTQRYASRASYFFSPIFFSNRKMCVFVCFVRVCVCVCILCAHCWEPVRTTGE